MASVIVDLSYLTTCSADDIKQDMNGQTVLVTCELIYEIMTNSRGLNPRKSMDKIGGLNLVLSRPLIGLVNEEVRTSKRASHVVDRTGTRGLVDFVTNGTGIPVKCDVAEEVRLFFEKDEPRRLREGLERMWDSRLDDLFEQVRVDGDISIQAKQYLRMMKQLGDDGIGHELASEHHMSESPGPGWLIYDWERLRNFLCFRYRLNAMRANGLEDKKLANNLLDLSYLAFLGRVECIATCDTKLIVPLAKAFFPSCHLVGRAT